MHVNSIDPCDCYSGIDEMINEGLGGGFIIQDYDAKKLEIRNISPKIKQSIYTINKEGSDKQ